MSGSGLGSMGFDRVQTGSGNTLQNWSIMMIAGSNIATMATNMDYVPVTNTLMLELSLLQTTPDLPVVPDWSALPDTATRSLLQLQFDLMLATMIRHQQQDNLVGMMTSLDQAMISFQHTANRQTISDGLGGLTGPQINMLLAAMSPMHVI